MPLPFLAMVAGSAFLMTKMGMQARQEEKERRMIMSTIDNAVKSGSPEALGMLNPEKLERYGVLELIPTYQVLAAEVGKQRQMAMRQLEAVTRAEESRARVGEATEESQINLSKSKAQVATIEAEQAEGQQQILRENPKLLMLPFEKQQVEVQNIQSQIQSRIEQTKLQWAQLGEMQRHHKASEGIQGQGMKVGQLLERATMDALAGLPEEERSAVLLNRLSPGMESNQQRELTMYSSKYENAGKTWQAVKKGMDDRAMKEGREELTYNTKAEADNAALALNKVGMEQNYFRDVLRNKFGAEAPEAPMFEVVPIPGKVFGEKWVKGYQLVTKTSEAESEADRLLRGALEDLGKGSITKPMEKKPVSPTEQKESSGRRTFVDPNRGRAVRGSIGEKAKEVK